MLNDIAESQAASFAETSTLGNHVLDLCDHLHKFRRPILAVGGSADRRVFGLGWDVMVRQIIRMARAQGIPTIDGVQYDSDLERPPGNWHSTRTEANHDIYLKLFEDARNVAYAITPHGPYS